MAAAVALLLGRGDLCGIWGVSSEEVLCILSEAPVLWLILWYSLAFSMIQRMLAV